MGQRVETRDCTFFLEQRGGTKSTTCGIGMNQRVGWACGDIDTGSSYECMAEHVHDMLNKVAGSRDSACMHANMLFKKMASFACEAQHASQHLAMRAAGRITRASTQDHRHTRVR
eukprot:366132-Chlamydomonas_euryale.AAC.3